MIGSREQGRKRGSLAGIAALAFGIALSGAACKGKDEPTPGDPSKAAPLAGSDAPASPATATTVGEVLETSRHPWLRWPNLSDVKPALVDLYGREFDRLVWFEGERPLPAAEEAIGTLSKAEEHALRSFDYDADRIQAEWKRLQAGTEVEETERALFDLAVSIGVLREIQAVRIGRVDPRTLGWGYDVTPRKVDRAALLLGARDGSGVSALLDALEPGFPHYKRNRRMLAHYRRLAEAGEPEPVPALEPGRRKVVPGEPWDGVPQLRSRLRIFGDLEVEEDAPTLSAPEAPPVYDGALVEAVKRFQGRHILDADGVLGTATLEALNVPLSARVRQLELAMERGRWLPPLTDRPTVFVNVPLFRLWASDPVREEEVLRMKVVVGKSMTHHTPLFVQDMEYVIFRPYWNPPPSIVREEILPRVRKNPSYLTAERYEIVASGEDTAAALPATPANLQAVEDGRLYIRQKPGPTNSLGLVKFIFPNRANVYMHGTPAPYLFARTRRDFSHGCIRLENPAGLAEWVLRDVPGWTPERIYDAMQGTRPTQVNVREPLRVVIFYDTVHVNSEMVVHFVGDIYGYDRTLDEVLARGYPYPEAS
jgi:murein L,D-transpeptidase YcbB/YkuD